MQQGSVRIYVFIAKGKVKTSETKEREWYENIVAKLAVKQEGFLPCQTPTSTVRLKVEGCRVEGVELGV